MENFPAANAKRYVEMGGVSAKASRVRAPAACRDISAPFATVSQSAGTSSASVQRALRSGWSKQGNASCARAGTKMVYRKSSLRLSGASPASKSSVSTLLPRRKTGSRHDDVPVDLPRVDRQPGRLDPVKGIRTIRIEIDDERP